MLSWISTSQHLHSNGLDTVLQIQKWKLVLTLTALQLKKCRLWALILTSMATNYHWKENCDTSILTRKKNKIKFTFVISLFLRLCSFTQVAEKICYEPNDISSVGSAKAGSNDKGTIWSIKLQKQKMFPPTAHFLFCPTSILSAWEHSPFW